MISVGRAGCIRSNIMQAHTGLNALDPLGSGPLYVWLHRDTLHSVHAEHKAPGTRERFSRTSGFRVCAYTYIRNHEIVLRSLSVSLFLRLSLSLPVCLHSCVYLYPTCIEIAGALNPGSGHEIVIPERLTLLPHLAGPWGRA